MPSFRRERLKKRQAKRGGSVKAGTPQPNRSNKKAKARAK